MALADLVALVVTLAGSEAVTAAGAAARDEAIQAALRQYGRDRPRLVVADVTGDGTTKVSPPADWLPGVPGLTIEYPLDQDPSALLPSSVWRVYYAPAGIWIMVYGGIPAGHKLRLTYPAAHEVDADTDTVPPEDREAIASYAAHLILIGRAGATAGDSDSTIQVDAVNHAGKSDAYAKRARDLRGQYYNLLGIDPKRLAGASATVPVGKTGAWGGTRLFRRGRS